ncbi:MAG: PTS transporter subunit EIIB [Erysipelotrichales bacterium]|nr:PTS transporter subunit EIIB [Erysipelotrichales bacterium]
MYLESNFANFFKDYGIYIAIALVVLITIFVVVLLITNKAKSKKGSNNINDLLNNIIEALGGKDNIKGMEAKMSRLNVSLLSDDKIDIEKLKSIGVERVIKMSNKITLLIGSSATDLANEFNK